MADSKKYNGSTWEHSLRKLGTSTDTITTLPAEIYADGTNATVGLKGNMSQSGTPSPSSPIQPQECGVRTENLWNEDYTGIQRDAIKYQPLNVGDGDYTLSSTVAVEGQAAVLFLLAGNVSSGATTVNNGVWNGQNRTVTAVDGYVTIGYRKYSYNANPENANTMLNSGSTPQPYEPYGYKIPISSASTTTPVYLGEVQTTRKIVKYEFTGQENWTYRSGQPSNVFFTDLSGINYINNNMLCTHYLNQDSGSYDDMEDKHILLRVNGDLSGARIAIRDTNFTDGAGAGGREELKAWLAQQYANGTPVTIWYVLATETTDIVNEPLRKIGDYADTVNGISIPTITGADSFDVLTTLKPSEVELAYTGWHDATVKEWDGSQWD